jgi:hypothetical protein
MFGLFSRVSTEKIEAAVRSALERYETTGDLRRAIDTLAAFADEHDLGSSRRARIARHVAAFFVEGGVAERAAAGYGAVFALFVTRRVDPLRLHWRAFEAGVEGAIRHLSGWDEAEATAAAVVVEREYRAKPHLRAAIRESYELGWSICGDAELSSGHGQRLGRHTPADQGTAPVRARVAASTRRER